MKPTVRTAFLFILYVLFPALLTAQSGWKPDERLTFFQGYSYDPRAACCGDTIHVVWWEGYVDTMIHEEVYYKRSTNAGESWGAGVLLSVEDDQNSVLPQIAVSGSMVHVIWFEHDYGLLYRQSLDGGTTWEDIDSIVALGVHSSIDVFGDTVYVCGITGSTGDLLFTRSINCGNNWGPIQVINFSANDSPTLRSMLNNALGIVISYEDTPEIYSVRSFDGGETWLDSQLVSEGIASGSQMPAMDLDDSAGIHITWYDYKYSPYSWTGDIFYRVSRDSGYTWEPIDSLTTQHRAVASDILAEGNNLHLVWEDDRHDFNDNFEIYYRMSTDLGQTWEDEVRLTDAINWSRMPSLACGGQYLHLFWFDLRDDPNNIVGEIYYKRKTLTGIQETVSGKFRSLGLSLYCSSILRRSSLIRYDLGDKKQGLVDLIDITGRVVMTFPVHGNSGEFVLSFNKEVGTGVYFLILKAGNGYTIKKVSVIY